MFRLFSNNFSTTSVGLLVEAYITILTASPDRNPSDSKTVVGILMTPILSLHLRITKFLQLYVILGGVTVCTLLFRL